MKSMDSRTLSELIDLLVPFMQDEDERRAILWLALGKGSRVLQRLTWQGPAETFILRMATLLVEYGEIHLGKQALWAVLEVVRERADTDQRRRIDDLYSIINLSSPVTNEEMGPEREAPPRRIRAFLSSPGDVADERALAVRVFDHLLYDPLLRGRVEFDLVAWDKPGADTPLLATLTPQEAINQGLSKPSECDIVIVIFWARMGTIMPPEYRKADGGRYLSGTEWEYEDAMKAAQGSDRPFVVVYRRTEEVSLKPSDPDFMRKYEQWQQVNSFFSTFTNTDGSIKHGFNTYTTPDEFQSKLESHLRELVRRLLVGTGTYTFHEQRAWSSGNAGKYGSDKGVLTWKGSPFPGLRPFEMKDALVFYGRGAEVDRLVAMLSTPTTRFAAVVGSSGSGKSSLVWAGLLSRLQDNAIAGSKDWVTIRFRPDELGTGDPYISLASALSKDLLLGIPDRELADLLREQPERLASMVEDRLRNRPAWTEVIFFIDQFEEVFTAIGPEYRSSFIDFCATMATSNRFRTVITLRSDFYAQCVEHAKLAELLRTGSFPLSNPGLGALYQMITRPAARAGLQLERGLAERILEDTGNEPGSLALMAYTLFELYRASEASGWLSMAAYEALGGVKGAIGTQAERVFARLDNDAKAALPNVFRKLISVNDEGLVTRQRVLLSIVIDSSEARMRFVTALTIARLLVQGVGERDEPILEVAHEALLDGWPLLRNWIQSTRDDLRLLREIQQASHAWVRHNRDRAYLWPHERLLYVYDMIRRLDLNVDRDLDRDAREFIKPEYARLLIELDQASTTQSRRATISDRLAEIGDLRPGVGLRPDGLPDFVWCPVPGGKLKLEDLSGTYDIQPFHISKYPVTYSQYQAFVQAPDGYQNLQWWDNIPKEPLPGEQFRTLANHPAESMSWYEAVAFCRWASSRLGLEIRLPTECEWQQAATGGDPANVHPWGTDWDSDHVNTAESGLGRTIAVGMYPLGASPVGAEDMIGNVWEWCLNKSPDPEDDAIEESDLRAVRGGCWYHERGYGGYTTFRNPRWDHAYPRSHLRGFRVICVGMERRKSSATFPTLATHLVADTPRRQPDSFAGSDAEVGPANAKVADHEWGPLLAGDHSSSATGSTETSARLAVPFSTLEGVIHASSVEKPSVVPESLTSSATSSLKGGIRVPWLVAFLVITTMMLASALATSLWPPALAAAAALFITDLAILLLLLLSRKESPRRTQSRKAKVLPVSH